MEGSIVLAADAAPDVPERLPLLPLDSLVVFPNVVVPLAIVTPRHVSLIDEVLQSNKTVALATLEPDREDTEDAADDPPFYDVGTLAQIVRMMKLPDGSARILVQGMLRLRLEDFQKRDEWWFARTRELETSNPEGKETEALRRAAATLFQQAVELSPLLTDDLLPVIGALPDASKLADFIASNAGFDTATKQALLAEGDVRARLEQVAELLGEEIEILRYRSEIQDRVKNRVDKTQREFWLRQQMQEIQQELGEGESGEAEQLRAEIEAAELSEAARSQAEKELARLERMSPQSAEYHVVRTYLDWLMDLPWAEAAAEPVELATARRVLNRDHYDLEKIKERVVEYLAVRKLNPRMQGPILCFVGPPGVGKTSLGRSIAEALGRKFVRISLGGVRDEAEIRGHRRTYVGALPGRIIQALKTAGVSNPVFMLDEIDKVGQGVRGDPTAALLEVLDPAQNDTFADHYLEVPFDLSKVIFIATANSLSTVPRPLLDRMEVLHLSAYTANEKFHIARRYLIPRQTEEHGLQSGQVSISAGALRRVISEYTREAGVRELERTVARLMRKAAVQLIEGDSERVRITQRNLERFLGPPRFRSEIAGRRDETGVATGLAWTPVGGEILFIEAVRMPGKGGIRLTGQLGEVMKESAQAAYSFLRSNATELEITEESFSSSDVHLHVPAGATPKDGPSAGVAMAVALASLLSGRPVRRDVAMTGEITLRGHVLPVGGIREKVIAANRAGIRKVLLPEQNRADVAEIPEEVREALEIKLIEHVDEALDAALLERAAGEAAAPIEHREFDQLAAAGAEEAA